MQNIGSHVSSHGIQKAARSYVTFVSAPTLQHRDRLAFNRAEILGLAGQNAAEEYDVCLHSPFLFGAFQLGMQPVHPRFSALQTTSNNSTMSPEQILADAEPGQAFAWQMYYQTDRKKSEDTLTRINAISNIKFICLTLDAPVPGKREDDERSKNMGSSLPVTSAVIGLRQRRILRRH